MDTTPKAKIFVFYRKREDEDDLIASAIDADGRILAGHICADETFVKSDMGVDSTWKHEQYNAEFPDGWEIEYVGDVNDAASDTPFAQAYEKYVERKDV